MGRVVEVRGEKWWERGEKWRERDSSGGKGIVVEGRGG